jgi:hypothetical protein
MPVRSIRHLVALHATAAFAITAFVYVAPFGPTRDETPLRTTRNVTITQPLLPRSGCGTSVGRRTDAT